MGAKADILQHIEAQLEVIADLLAQLVRERDAEKPPINEV